MTSKLLLLEACSSIAFATILSLLQSNLLGTVGPSWGKIAAERKLESKRERALESTFQNTWARKVKWESAAKKRKGNPRDPSLSAPCDSHFFLFSTIFSASFLRIREPSDDSVPFRAHTNGQCDLRANPQVDTFINKSFTAHVSLSLHFL